jgi:hypothetical protein
LDLGNEAYDDQVSTTPLRRARSPGPRTLWLTGRALRLHVTLIIVACGCLAAGGFELSRALSGNVFSWVYVFEWPLFASLSVVSWWRLLHEHDPAEPASALEPPRTAGVRPAPALAGNAFEGEQLRAWQDYLARLHAERRPGIPSPARRSG